MHGFFFSEAAEQTWGLRRGGEEEWRRRGGHEERRRGRNKERRRIGGEEKERRRERWRGGEVQELVRGHPSKSFHGLRFQSVSLSLTKEEDFFFLFVQLFSWNVKFSSSGEEEKRERWRGKKKREEQLKEKRKKRNIDYERYVFKAFLIKHTLDKPQQSKITKAIYSLWWHTHTVMNFILGDSKAEWSVDLQGLNHLWTSIQSAPYTLAHTHTHTVRLDQPKRN